MHDAPATTRAQLVRRWPRGIWNQLTAIDARLLELLAYLSKLSAQRSPTHARYCVPGRPWLAEQLACSTTTISRHTSKLRDLGVLSKTQRRPIHGIWQTCLYSIVHPRGWQMAALRSTITKLAHRVSKPTHLASSSSRKNLSKGPNESLRDIIQRGMAKFVPK